MRSHSYYGVVLPLMIAGIVLGSVPAASAVPLFPGATIFAVGEFDPTGGIPIAGPLPVPFVAPTFSGMLTSTVIAGDPSNPFGGLTFTYLLDNFPISANSIGRLTINDYAGFLVDSSFEIPLAGVAPTLNDRSLGVGDVIGFSFIGPPLGAGTLVPGSTSALLVVQTNAPAFVPTFASVIDGSVVSVATFAPAVPEPSTLLSALIGICGLLLVSSRRFKRGRSI